MTNEYGQRLELVQVMKIPDKGRVAKIYYCAELEEFCTKFFTHGVYLKEADSFEYDLDSARGTARAELFNHADSWGSDL